MYILFVRFISEYLLYFLFFSIFWFLARKDLKTAIKIVISVILAYAIRTIAGHLWFEPRPFMANPQLLLYPTKETGSSFFSGHTTLAFAVAGSVFWAHKKIGYGLLIAAAIVGLGRILAGLHYPQDVFIGALVGFGVSYLVNKVYVPIAKKFRELQSTS